MTGVLMKDEICCVPAWWSGVWHRYMLLDQIRHFAEYFHYDVQFWWGVSEGVAYCRFEELFAAIPGIKVLNVDESDLHRVERMSRSCPAIRHRGREFQFFRKSSRLTNNLFVYDDPVAVKRLEQLVPSGIPHKAPLRAVVAPKIAKGAKSYISRYRITERVGVRCRVTECPTENRKPHRVAHELNEAVRSIVKLPWHTRVFVVTDSEYVQQMLRSHFLDAAVLPKRFSLVERGSRYVHRHDKEAMITYLHELTCLHSCRKIVNLGGFLNQERVQKKLVANYFDASVY